MQCLIAGWEFDPNGKNLLSIAGKKMCGVIFRFDDTEKRESSPEEAKCRNLRIARVTNVACTIWEGGQEVPDQDWEWERAQPSAGESVSQGLREMMH